jgi:hypothetical protein
MIIIFTIASSTIFVGDYIIIIFVTVYFVIHIVAQISIRVGYNVIRSGIVSAIRGVLVTINIVDLRVNICIFHIWVKSSVNVAIVGLRVKIIIIIISIVIIVIILNIMIHFAIIWHVILIG